MTYANSLRRRRRRDRSIAAVIAVVAVVVGLIVYLNSDIRAATLNTGPTVAVPSADSVLPTSLTQRWTAVTRADLGAAVSPDGVVVTADEHTATARDAKTGAVRWTYSRSNRTLCAIGTGDIDTLPVTDTSSVRGIATVYDENGYCSQVMTFDPITGARSEVRTGPNEEGGQLIFGGPYAAWFGPTLIDEWRYDLVRTIQYGDEPNPTMPNTAHLGCTFTDMAIADTQMGTIEHCAAQGDDARIVLNFDDPKNVDNHPSNWDELKHDPRMDVDTGSPSARIVGISADRVAVLVSSPSPAVVVYDATGKITSRTSVNIPAADIVAADKAGKVTPNVRTAGERFSLIGSHLLAVSDVVITAPAPATSFPSTTTASAAAKSTGPANVQLTDLQVSWNTTGVIGLPAVRGSSVLIPVSGGLETADASKGPSLLTPSVIKVDRGSYKGRVDASAVGSMIIEVRGAGVVALS